MPKQNTKNKQANSYFDTLKSRNRTEASGAAVVAKPRKMNLVKPRRKVSTRDSFANSALLVFPTDAMGITSELKSALIKVASRINSDEKVLNLVNEVMEIGKKHIEAKFKENKSQGLRTEKRRRVYTGVEQGQEAAKESEGTNTPESTEVSYNDMLQALAEAEVTLKSKKKADVQKAYAKLNAGGE